MGSPLQKATDLCLQNHSLDDDLIATVVEELFKESTSDSSRKKFLEAFTQKGETASEILHFSENLLKKSTPFPITRTWNEKPLFDCCGTGGGGLSLFNVSTALIPILASLNIPVVKHGNRGFTKKSGSADVLTALGIPLELTPPQAFESLKQNSCVFLLAPHFHPHLKMMAPVRKELGQEGKRTIFNLLGPLLNPAQPQAQLLGIFQKEHLVLFHEIFLKRKTDHVIVYGKSDQEIVLGEVSPWGKQELRCSSFDLQEVLIPLHLKTNHPSETLASLLVENADQSAEKIIRVLKNEEKGLAREIIVRNATTGLLVAGGAGIYSEAQQKVEEAIDSGKAFKKLEQWRQWQP